MQSITLLKEKNNNCQELIKINPEVVLTAVRGQNGGAVKLWYLARHKSSGGSGAIPAKVLRRYVIGELGKPRADYDNWLAGALLIGLLVRCKDNLLITGLAIGADILGVSELERPVYVPLNRFISKGWLSWVWAGYVKRTEGKLISRWTLREITGIPERTQRGYEKKARVINQRSYAKDQTRGPDKIADIVLFERSGAFVNNGVITWRLPNSRKVNGIKPAAKGSTKQTNAKLKWLANNVERDQKATRRYCEDDKQLVKAQKNIRRLGRKGVNGLPNWLYLFAKEQYGTRFYHAIPA